MCPVDTDLSWTAAGLARTHDVYFGTTLADVNGAGRANPKGVLVSQGQNATTYDPAGRARRSGRPTTGASMR